MDLKMKCQTRFGFEKPKSVHLWKLSGAVLEFSIEIDTI